METLTQPSVQKASKAPVNRLKFYRDELEAMRKKLSEIVKKNSSSGVLSMIDHFENLILIHEKVNVDLKHRIKSTEKNLEIIRSVNSSASKNQVLDAEREMLISVSEYERTYNDLRAEYIQFLSKNL